MGLLSWLARDRPDPPRYPPAPPGLVLYAIGDLHGRDDLLRRTQTIIDADAVPPEARKVEIYLGDYIDRGQDSSAVIDRLLARVQTRACVFLRGNHELIFQSFLAGEIGLDAWRPLGGVETLLSYGITAEMIRSGGQDGGLADELARRLPESHRAFLDALENSFELGDYFFVHAGVRPGIPLQQQSPDDLLWIRENFLSHSGGFERIIVHGHSPVPAPEFLPGRINIDTGAYVTGRLTCLKINADGAVILGDSAASSGRPAI